MPDIIRTSGQLGPILKRLRKAKGWSQLALGKKIGLSQERISVIENHPERVSIDQLLTVLMALGAELQVEQRSQLSANASALPAAASRSTKSRESW